MDKLWIHRNIRQYIILNLRRRTTIVAQNNSPDQQPALPPLKILNQYIKDLSFEISEDIKTITADYLIENIDYAFKTINLPWNFKLSFNDFCALAAPASKTMVNNKIIFLKKEEFC